MRQLLRIPFWLRMAVVTVMAGIFAAFPSVPGSRILALVLTLAILAWAACEIALAWREYKAARSEESHYYIRLSWPMVAAVGFGLICVLLLVTQLLGAR